MSTINLLPNAAKFKAYRESLKVLNKKLIVVELITGGALIVVIVAIRALLMIIMAGANREMARWTKQYTSLAPRAEANQKIKYQAKIVGQVLASRFEYGEAFTQINQLFPVEAKIDKSELKNNTNSFFVSGVIGDDAVVDKLEEMVIDINNGKNKYFKKMELTGVGWGAGGWKFEAVIDLKDRE